MPPVHRALPVYHRRVAFPFEDTPRDGAIKSFPRPPAAEAPSRIPHVVGALALALGFAGGFAAQRLVGDRLDAWRPSVSLGTPTAPAAAPEVAPARAPRPPGGEVEAPPPEPASAKPAPATPRRRAAPATRGAGTRREVGKGTLAVTAPQDSDVLLDGRRIGRGAVRVEIAAGPHRIEVRRGGATVRERFSVAAGETWTYDVTATP
jgi:eukaryotic-like serine/threonine-protein kinase